MLQILYIYDWSWDTFNKLWTTYYNSGYHANIIFLTAECARKRMKFESYYRLICHSWLHYPIIYTTMSYLLNRLHLKYSVFHWCHIWSVASHYQLNNIGLFFTYHLFTLAIQLLKLWDNNITYRASSSGGGGGFPINS